jgi:signal transduction histidine kinase
MPEITPLAIEERYKHLIVVLQALAPMLNTELLLEQIVKEAANLSDAQSAWLLRPDQSNPTLRVETSTLGKNPTLRGLVIPIESYLEGWVFQNQKPVIINETNGYDHKYGKIPSITNLPIKSILSLPLTTKDEPIGVLEVVNNQDGSFSNIDLEIMEAFANQIAIYIDNTHHFLQSDLVAELVHELRTPLASLNTAIQLLQRSDLPANKRAHIFEMISTEFNRLADMTTSFLDYARLESGRAKFQTSKFDLNKLLAESVEVMQMQADGKGIKITFDAPSTPLMLTADKDKIKQVIFNLLTNAIKYNHPRGNVIITSQLTPMDISFSIRDDGQGIPGEFIPYLFRRFFRAPSEENQSLGTGLGLSICRQIVEAHKGNIEVTSVDGQGTVFTVSLPVIRDL